MSPATDWASFVGGLIAGEGTFVCTGRRPSFTFSIRLGAADGDLLREVKEFFGCGTLHWYPRRKAHYDDEMVFQVRRLADLVGVVVPYMDEHLPPSYKRLQYEAWRDKLVLYCDQRPRGPRRCAVPGCTEPARALDRCRHHYYLLTGR
ncbi:MAG TPA: LAGLIDADG family homing endonuclease [Acidimicrobiales bacterium]|nr:LAGLIDADG family homing endonuclease [Acidimicrobiales bacterium]